VAQEAKSRVPAKANAWGCENRERTSLWPTACESVHENNAGSHLSACALCVVLRARGQRGVTWPLSALVAARAGEAPFVLQVN